MKGDFHVRFCERLRLKCFGLLDRCYLRLQFAHIFVSNKSNKLPGNFYRSQSTSNLDTV